MTRPYRFLTIIMITFIAQIIPPPIFADNTSQDEQVLRSEIGMLKKELQYLRDQFEVYSYSHNFDLDELKKQYFIENLAEDKLLEIANTNLQSSNFYVSVFSVITAIAIFISGVFVHILTKLQTSKTEQMFKDFQKELSEKQEISIKFARKEQLEIAKSLNDKVEAISLDAEKKIAVLNSALEKLEQATDRLNDEYHRVKSNSNYQEAFKHWYNGEFDEAVRYCESVLATSEKRWGTKPENMDSQKKLATIRSNLAYFYVDANRTDMHEKAVSFAIEGLEWGLRLDDMNLVDNYLYVISAFSDACIEHQRWAKVYLSHSDILIDKGIRTTEELTLFIGFYKQIQDNFPSIKLN